MRTSSALALATAALLALVCASDALAQDVAAANAKSITPKAMTAPAGLPAPPPDAAAGVDAVDAAQALASALDGAGGGVTASDQLNALQDAASAGDPMAQWQLGLMYESGEGVAQDKAKALGYFAEIANQHADAPAGGTEADIVAQSFIKMGDYYWHGLPEAGIPKDQGYSISLLMQAATNFRDAEAQYRLGMLYLDKSALGVHPLQAARWLNSAAWKGHVAAQARLGDLLFNGSADVKANPVEGLMWLTVADRGAIDTADASWIDDLLNADMSIASPEQREKATTQADALQAQLGAP